MTCKSDQWQRQSDDWVQNISEISLSANKWFNEGNKGKCWPRSHWHKLADTEVIVVNRIIEERETNVQKLQMEYMNFPFWQKFQLSWWIVVMHIRWCLHTEQWLSWSLQDFQELQGWGQEMQIARHLFPLFIQHSVTRVWIFKSSLNVNQCTECLHLINDSYIERVVINSCKVISNKLCASFWWLLIAWFYAQ